MALITTSPNVRSALNREIVFAGDHVRLAGTIELPGTPAPRNGFPLLFILPHASSMDREDFHDYVQIALNTQAAIFRWDKRGTGHSGASAIGSTAQDAVNAYATALAQPGINRQQVMILAVGAATGVLGSNFEAFARLGRPAGVLLVANQLNAKDILALDAEIHILMSAQDWNPYMVYGNTAALAHRQVYPHGAGSTLISDSDRFLMVADARGRKRLHPDAQRVITAWMRR